MCVKIGVVRSFFLVFLTFLRAQNLSKFLGHCYSNIFLHTKSKNAKFLSFGVSYQKRAPGGTAHKAENPIFCAKNSKNAKSAPNFLKFGLSFLHQAFFLAKEASTNILSPSCSFCLLHALFNFAFKLLILAWHTIFLDK